MDGCRSAGRRRITLASLAVGMLVVACGADGEQAAADSGDDLADAVQETPDPEPDPEPGDGDPEPDPESEPDGIHPAGEELRLLEVGMEWTYDLEGELQFADGNSMDMGGTRYVEVVERDLDGETLLALEVTQYLAPVGLSGPPPGPPPGSDAPDEEAGGRPLFGPDADPTTFWYFVQDPGSRDIVLVGDSQGRDGDRKVADDGEVFVPGRFEEGAGYDNRLEWGEGTHTANRLEVEGMEVISTSLGDFETWVASHTSSGTDGVAVEGTDWWNARLGQPVRSHTVTQVPGGVVLELTALLRETNVDLV